MRKHSKPKFTIPLAIVAGFTPAIVRAAAQGGAFTDKAKRFCSDMTGYNVWSNKWQAGNMKYGLLPLAIGVIIHKVVGGMLGVNRMLARSGIPFIRI